MREDVDGVGDEEEDRVRGHGRHGGEDGLQNVQVAAEERETGFAWFLFFLFLMSRSEGEGEGEGERETKKKCSNGDGNADELNVTK